MFGASKFQRLLMAVVAEQAVERINRAFSAFIHDSQERPSSHVRFWLFAQIASQHVSTQKAAQNCLQLRIAIKSMVKSAARNNLNCGYVIVVHPRVSISPI
jgi:hypothetical protein